MSTRGACRALGIVTARSGSKGILDKNITPLAGRPLVVWTLQAASEAALLGRLVLSTDSEKIASVAAEASGVEIIKRPSDLAQDDTPHVDVLLHILDELDGEGSATPSYIVLLQPTSPLRTGADIDAAIRLAYESDAPAVVSVCEADTHPYLTYRLDEAGHLIPFIDAPVGYRRRQSLPPAYAPNGAVYVIRVDVLRRERTLYPAGTLASPMPRERSVDVDTELDLRVAEMMIAQELKP